MLRIIGDFRKRKHSLRDIFNAIIFYGADNIFIHLSSLAKKMLYLQKLHHKIELIAVISFEGQETKFPFFEKLRKKATHTVIIAPEYSNQAYHNGKPRSGTGSTIRKATEQGIEVVNLYNKFV